MGLNSGAALVGNIGISIARQVAEDPKEWYIAEISSFQLDDIRTFRQDIAILTNITEDHLDRYEYRFENYIRSKFSIVKNQTKADYFIYCEDDPVIQQHIKEYPFQSNPLPYTMQQEPTQGGFIRNGQMNLKSGNETLNMSIYDFALKGTHNQYNTMADQTRAGRRLERRLMFERGDGCKEISNQAAADQSVLGIIGGIYDLPASGPRERNHSTARGNSRRSK
jgi:UDP-N-acetylmuramoylalanine--D-glutamate ligase